ncbi:MAG: hypothetical protein JHD35_00755 [Sphingopyxis sp.]|nr:hypothetical protein [Sphingopyxis sp.]
MGRSPLIFALAAAVLPMASLIVVRPLDAKDHSIQRGPTIETLAGEPIASVPAALHQSFAEYEAENASHNGRVIGPDRRFGELPSEASGRRAVLLDRPGQRVTFRLARAANAITVRYAIPDSDDGSGLDGNLVVQVGDRRLATLALTSRYGWYYGKYPFTNDPGDGRAHHFFDHSRMLLGRTIPAGSEVSLSLDPATPLAWLAIDLADFEMAPPPVSPPPGALALTQFGADPEGKRDASTAFARAVAAAAAADRPLWIAPGRYRIDGHVELDNVEIVGAGMWYSVLFGRRIGLYGRTDGQASRRVRLRDFAILGDVRERVDTDQVNAIGGAMGEGSRIERLWLQHAKAGLWFDGPMDGIVVSGLRIFDMTADALNFHRSVSNAVVENSFIRGTGDDALAAWSGGGENRDIIFRRNVVVAPVLANGIAVYGGRGITISENLVADTLVEGGGIHVGNRFDAVPLSGSIRIADNLLVRSGSFDPNWKFGVGAIWFYALDAPIDADIQIDNLILRDSSEDDILFIGSSVKTVRLSRLRVEGNKAALITSRSAGQADIVEPLMMAATPVYRRCDPSFRLSWPLNRAIPWTEIACSPRE